jgi:hypothetical protein
MTNPMVVTVGVDGSSKSRAATHRGNGSEPARRTAGGQHVLVLGRFPANFKAIGTIAPRLIEGFNSAMTPSLSYAGRSTASRRTVLDRCGACGRGVVGVVVLVVLAIEAEGSR